MKNFNIGGLITHSPAKSLDTPSVQTPPSTHSVPRRASVSDTIGFPWAFHPQHPNIQPRLCHLQILSLWQPERPGKTLLLAMSLLCLEAFHGYPLPWGRSANRVTSPGQLAPIYPSLSLFLFSSPLSFRFLALLSLIFSTVPYSLCPLGSSLKTQIKHHFPRKASLDPSLTSSLLLCTFPS